VVALADRSTRDVIDMTAEVVDGPEWFADNQVAVIVRESGKLVLLTLRADGSGTRRFPLLHHKTASHLRISPDSRYAAFHTEGGDYGAIEIMDLASGREQTLVLSAYKFGDGSGPEGMGLGDTAWRNGSDRSDRERAAILLAHRSAGAVVQQHAPRELLRSTRPALRRAGLTPSVGLHRPIARDGLPTSM